MRRFIKFNFLFNLLNHGNNKFKYLILTLLFKTVINFLLLFYVAKITDVEAFGVFSFAFVIMTLGILLMDYGYNLQVLVIEGEHTPLKNTLSSILSGKIIILAILTLFFIPFLFFLELEYEAYLCILFLSISSIPNTFGNFYFALFKAKDNYHLETIGFVIQGCILTVLLVLNHFFGTLDITTISGIVLFSKISHFIFAYFKVRKHFNSKFKFKFIQGVLSLKKSLSFGTHVILGTLILYIDTLVLTYLTDMESVGFYQSGIRIIMAASLFGAIITDGYVPEISRNVFDRTFIRKRMTDLFTFLLGFYFLLLVTLGFYFNTIIKILYSDDFISISKYLIYILLIILLRSLGIVPGVILTSLGFQQIRAKAVVISCIISLTLNLLFIPFYGIEGAFLAFLGTNLVLNCIYFYHAIKKLNFIRLISPLVLLIVTFYLIIHILFAQDSIDYLLFSILINIFLLVGLLNRLKQNKAYVSS